MKKITIKSLIIIFSSIIGGFLLLFLVYLLPTKPMQENVKESVYIFEEQGTYFSLIPRNYATQLDNYTDALMLQNAIYDGNESIINKIINVYRYNSNEYVSPVKSLVDTVNNSDDMTKATYDRYWHGYLLLLKPLLLIFNYSEIKLINILCQTILIAYIIYGFIKNNKIKPLIAYLLALGCIYPFVISLSLQFSTMFYIFNLGVAFVLWKNDSLKRNNNYLYLFLGLGILTSYMDYLTYPLTSVAVPLIVYLLLNYQKSFWQNVKTIVCSGIFWAIGYVVMWASKWVVGSAILGKNLISTAIDQILFRTSGAATNYTSRLDVIKDNFSYFKPLFIMCLILLIFYVIIKWIRKDIRFEKRNIIKYTPILLLGLLPLIWFVVTSNHSSIHAWFTYRNLIIFALSLFSYILLLFEDNKLKKSS